MFIASVIATSRSSISRENIFYHVWNTFKMSFKHENSNSMDNQLRKRENIKLNKYIYIYNIYFVHLIKKYSFSNKYSTIINKQFQFMQYTSLVNTEHFY